MPLSDEQDLLACFYADPSVACALEPVEPVLVPPPYRRLLDHSGHMTETLEAFHGCPVAVRVLEVDRRDGKYARKSLLARSCDDRIVQFGIVRLDPAVLTPGVRSEIEGEGTPLGRVLIQHGVLREVRLVGLWKVDPGQEMRDRLQLSPETTVFGRSAWILVDGKPAVELLEIVNADP